MARRKISKLDCGHYGVDPCTLCAERAAVETIERRAAERAAGVAARPVMPDPFAAGAVGAAPTAASAVLGTGEPVAGIYNLPDSIYHRDPLRAYGKESLSGSSARWLIPPSTPAHYRWRVDHPNEPTEAMIFGSAVHALTMGTKELAIFEGRSWESKAGAEFLRIHDPDGDDAPILARDVARAEAMALALQSHPIVAKMLRGAEFEQAVFAQDPETGAWMRGKIDILQQAAGSTLIVGDVKTTTGLAHEWEMERVAAKLSYHVSDAHYARLLQILGLAKKVTMLYAVVESKPPYLVAVHEISGEDIRRAEELQRLAVRRFAHCLTTGRWPGYAERIGKLTLPVYAARNEEDVLIDDHEGES